MPRLEVTFNPSLRVTFTNSGTNCVYPTDHMVNNPWKIKMGRQLAVYNGGSGLGFIIHADNQDGLNHEAQRARTAPCRARRT